MKKNILFTLILAFVTFTSFQNVNAMEKIEENQYINVNGIIMSEQQINNLKGLGFTDDQINKMTQDEFDNNKDIEAEVVAETTKYYKTIIVHDNSASEFSVKAIGSDIPYSYTEEVTEEEYNNSSDTSLIMPYGLTNGYTETNYKKMTTTISYISSSNNYRYKNDLVWKTIPSTRSYDIIAIGIDSTVSVDPNSTYFQQNIDIYNDFNGTCRYTYDTSGVWSASSRGYARTFKIPDNSLSLNGYVGGLSSYMYFNVQKLTSNTIYVLNAYGSYKHAQKSVSSSVSTGVTVGFPEIISFSGSVSTTVVESYDSMSTAHAAYSGLSW